MKKIFAIALSVVLSLSSVLPVFASGEIISNVSMTTTSKKHDDEVRGYLKDMKCPQHVKLTSLNNSDNIYSDFSYRFEFDNKLKAISKERDKTGCNRYPIYVEALIWADNIHEEYAISRSGCYSEEGLINTGNIVTFYPGMFQEGHIYENDFYFFYDGCVEYVDKYGYKNLGYDLSKHYINVQLRYMVLDSLTGEVYYSQFTSPLMLGKGHEVKIDDPITEFKSVPQVSEFAKKYYIDYLSSKPFPYYVVKVKESKEIRDASYNNAGKTYLEIEVRTKDGMYVEVNKVPYEYVNSDEYITCYLPGATDMTINFYDFSKASFRLRYEYYLDESNPDKHMPDAVGPWTNLTIQ